LVAQADESPAAEARTIQLPRCSMQPNYLKVHLPARGWAYADEPNGTGICEGFIPPRTRGASQNLVVSTSGPYGSARYWDVTVAVPSTAVGGGQEDIQPLRGVCLTTSTVGWRTLQRFGDGPLPWLDDVDGDGRQEFILWSSFALHDAASLAEFGLMAWVYKLAGDSLAIDMALSRTMAKRIAAAYKTSSPAAHCHYQERSRRSVSMNFQPIAVPCRTQTAGANTRVSCGGRPFCKLSCADADA
jgi:hypothetical protein